jgi:hypothetical protein
VSDWRAAGDIEYPPRHYVRFGELKVWLVDTFGESHGVRIGTVRRWLREGVIRGHRLAIYKRQRVYVAREVVEQIRDELERLRTS